MALTSLLVASDLSERSDRALQRAFRLAGEHGARVRVLTVVDDGGPEELVADIVERSRGHLEAAVAAIAGEVEHEIVVERGDPLSRLVEAVNEGDADLVVVGRHRSRGVFDRMRPTTVENVVARSLKPVLLVVAPALGPYQRVLSPVTFVPACRHAVEKALILASDATFRLFHAWIAPFEGLTGGRRSAYARAVERETAAQAAAWAELLPPSLPKVELVHDAAGESLVREMRRFSPDLIALGANARDLSFTGLGAFTAALVRDPATDTLIARGAEMG
ncbi:universal stress protein [Wenxinia marina]|uniref:Universal stress protein UspA n=1 Tax=Wenxinia marina DSM 24838 TaxID=1123501 RepID=A0A0D0QG52_9RHOB|nr:universal stress protein [Wenxinia marina]KIQ71207.1 Universal stress protein UspA [Wenxinia marina DSM 24838]GGL81625.1 hypothetical protein GCM10011392_40310 [Wenxinia marina]